MGSNPSLPSNHHPGNGLSNGQGGNPGMNGTHGTHGNGSGIVNFTAKREAERSAAQDSHILHLRQQIESRLKVRQLNMRTN